MQWIDALRIRRIFFLFTAAAFSLSGCWSSDTAQPTASINAPSYGDVSTGGMPPRRQLNLHPKVQVHTSAGDFTIQLDAESSPLTVDNFLSYISAGQYKGTIFHQVYNGFIVLGGGYDANFKERPTQPPVRNEAHNGLKNTRGAVAMARQLDSIDSATCQFFINLDDNSSLDHAGSDSAEYGYCVFGKVIDGLDVVDRIGKSPVHNTPQFENVPVQPVVIESMHYVE